MVLARLKMDGFVMESLYLHVLKNHRARNHLWTQTPSFINALRRFLSRRGPSKADWSGPLTPSYLLTIKCPAGDVWQKYMRPRGNLCTGDEVVIKDTSVCRSVWHLARVATVCLSTSDQVCKVSNGQEEVSEVWPNALPGDTDAETGTSRSVTRTGTGVE